MNMHTTLGFETVELARCGTTVVGRETWADEPITGGNLELNCWVDYWDRLREIGLADVA